MDKIKDLLTRGVKEIIVKKDLEKALSSGKKLRVKLGIDPNVADLHLGHAVPLRKLRAFQDLGHKAVLILGDYTAQIGDPSGKDKTREVPDNQDIKKNAHDFLDQAFKILDQRKTEYRFQSEWFAKFDLKKTIGLLSKMTVEHIMSHETFRQRLKKHQPFFMHEMVYPLMQGYDSVEVKADIELGAMEQKFNLLAGRKIQRAYGQPEQNVMMLEFLTGLDGSEKMSKSLGNYVGLRDSAQEMYGKIMSIPDRLIGEYFYLCTDASIQEVRDARWQIKKDRAMLAKQQLAVRIVKLYHGSRQAAEAQKEFVRVFSRRQLPGKIADLKVGAKQITLIGALVKTQLADSRSDARRLIEQGGVRIDRIRVEDQNLLIKLNKPKILQVGKRKFVKLQK